MSVVSIAASGDGDSAVGCDVAIVGGGIVGLATALELQSRGSRVAVIDRDGPAEPASFGNAGVINRASILTIANPGVWRKAARYAANSEVALRIRYASLPHLARWLTHFVGHCNDAAWRRSARALNPLVAAAYEHHLRLAELTGARSLIKHNGYLKLFRSEASFAAARLEREILASAGVLTTVVDAAEIRDLEPALAPVFARGLLFPESGAIDNPGLLLDRYRQSFRDLGGRLVRGEAQGIEYGVHGIRIYIDGRPLSAPRAVIAAGAWSPRLLTPLGYHVPFLAERGYHAHFRIDSAMTLNRPFFDADAGYVAAPMGETIRVLSGIELARPDDPPDFSQLDTVTIAASKALPLRGMIEGSRWAGSRPSTPDGLPVIGSPTRHPRLLLAFGHGHIGLSTAPVTGRIIADLASGMQPTIPIEAFAIERFERSSILARAFSNTPSVRTVFGRRTAVHRKNS
jgi:D-amino-acid dehydrogenase